MIGRGRIGGRGRLRLDFLHGCAQPAYLLVQRLGFPPRSRATTPSRPLARFSNAPRLSAADWYACK